MPTDTNTLMNDAKCIFECVPGTDMKLAILISLFADLANVSADPSVLMNDAKCIQQCIPGADMKLAVLISLVDQITGGSSTINIFGVICGTGPPVLIPKTGCGIYIQTDSVPPGIMWLYYDGAWH